MATGTNIRTYFQGQWHEGDIPVMKAADHGSWLGTTVFDGARMVDGLIPDVEAHCARVNRSARALMITPTVETDKMVEIVREGLALYPKGTPVYIRPMYWALEGGPLGVDPLPDVTGFCICLEEIPMAPPDLLRAPARDRAPQRAARAGHAAHALIGRSHIGQLAVDRGFGARGALGETVLHKPGTGAFDIIVQRDDTAAALPVLARRDRAHGGAWQVELAHGVEVAGLSDRTGNHVIHRLNGGLDIGPVVGLGRRDDNGGSAGGQGRTDQMLHGTSPD